MQNLVIVESPTKARTLTRFLGGDYRIEATLGHLKDLPRKKLGIEIKKTAKDNSLEFTPQYVIIPERKKRLLELKTLSQKADKVILATDPDREGEAIAYHVLHELGGGQVKNKSKIVRIVFHEITKEAIDEALKNPGEVDLKLVDAQQARRILDRLVGYSLSPLLWNKLSKRWLSAGRVQSVTVRLIVEREREIEKFKKEEFWRIFGIYAGYNENFEAELISKNSLNYETTQSFDLFDGKYTVSKTSIQTEVQAKKIIEDLQTPFTVSAVDKKEIKRSPPPPFTTSKLQQDAGRVLYFSSKKTMQIAQKLYEEGAITYHRTDSFNLSEKFLSSAKSYIEKNYGQAYHNGEYRRFTTKSKVAQEAHEAIRPTKIEVTGSELFQTSADFNKDHIKLYELIWKRAVASQGSDAVFDATTIQITSANDYVFETKGSVIKFEGYLKIAGRNSDDKLLPTVAVGDQLKAKEFTKIQNFTSPPPRYSESTLIKVLEEKGIGRPSTYA
ncbi:type I DNA topoisomerase, partial [Candidatus Gottesmanbacteria bacterium]|nr:type I DNA topoisomerase [Candidatus Gottesmanbacteria bacterium]